MPESTVKLLLIHNLEPEDVSFNEPLEAAVAAHASFDAVYYDAIPPIDIIESDYDGVVISGVPVHYSIDTIDSRLISLQWIRQTAMPVLGICLGHQNIGRLYGASIIIGEEAEDDHISLRTVQADAMLHGIAAGASVRAYHGCSVTVPDDFILLASTDTCQNHLMKHRNKPIYGAQFHPELSDCGDTIIENFIRIARKTKQDRATEAQRTSRQAPARLYTADR